jgi:hypothetical protein
MCTGHVHCTHVSKMLLIKKGEKEMDGNFIHTLQCCNRSVIAIES